MRPLSRWQWDRAVIAALIALIAEVGLLALRRPEPAGDRYDPQPPTRLDQTRPRGSACFRWLEDAGGHTSVFIPVLMAAGVIVSGVAWTIEHVAGHRRPRRRAPDRRKAAPR